MEAPPGQNVLSTHTGLDLSSPRHMALIYHILWPDKLFSQNLHVRHSENGKEEMSQQGRGELRAELVSFNTDMERFVLSRGASSELRRRRWKKKVTGGNKPLANLRIISKIGSLFFGNYFSYSAAGHVVVAVLLSAGPLINLIHFIYFMLISYLLLDALHIQSAKCYFGKGHRCCWQQLAWILLHLGHNFCCLFVFICFCCLHSCQG